MKLKDRPKSTKIDVVWTTRLFYLHLASLACENLPDPKRNFVRYFRTVRGFQVTSTFELQTQIHYFAPMPPENNLERQKIDFKTQELSHAHGRKQKPSESRQGLTLSTKLLELFCCLCNIWTWNFPRDFLTLQKLTYCAVLIKVELKYKLNKSRCNVIQ